MNLISVIVPSVPTSRTRHLLVHLFLCIPRRTGIVYVWISCAARSICAVASFLSSFLHASYRAQNSLPSALPYFMDPQFWRNTSSPFSLPITVDQHPPLITLRSNDVQLNLVLILKFVLSLNPVLVLRVILDPSSAGSDDNPADLHPLPVLSVGLDFPQIS